MVLETDAVRSLGCSQNKSVSIGHYQDSDQAIYNRPTRNSTVFESLDDSTTIQKSWLSRSKEAKNTMQTSIRNAEDRSKLANCPRMCLKYKKTSLYWENSTREIFVQHVLKLPELFCLLFYSKVDGILSKSKWLYHRMIQNFNSNKYQGRLTSNYSCVSQS